MIERAVDFVVEASVLAVSRRIVPGVGALDLVRSIGPASASELDVRVSHPVRELRSESSLHSFRKKEEK